MQKGNLEDWFNDRPTSSCGKVVVITTNLCHINIWWFKGFLASLVMYTLARSRGFHNHGIPKWIVYNGKSHQNGCAHLSGTSHFHIPKLSTSPSCELKVRQSGSGHTQCSTPRYIAVSNYQSVWGKIGWLTKKSWCLQPCKWSIKKCQNQSFWEIGWSIWYIEPTSRSFWIRELLPDTSSSAGACPVACWWIHC